MSWDTDAMSVLPSGLQEEVARNFTPEFLAEKLSDHIVDLQAKNEMALKALLSLARAYSDWPMNVSDEDEQLISKLIEEAEK